MNRTSDRLSMISFVGLDCRKTTWNDAWQVRLWWKYAAMLAFRGISALPITVVPTLLPAVDGA